MQVGQLRRGFLSTMRKVRTPRSKVPREKRGLKG